MSWWYKCLVKTSIVFGQISNSMSFRKFNSQKCNCLPNYLSLKLFFWSRHTQSGSSLKPRMRSWGTWMDRVHWPLISRCWQDTMRLIGWGKCIQLSPRPAHTFQGSSVVSFFAVLGQASSQTLSSTDTKFFLVCGDDCLLWWGYQLDGIENVQTAQFRAQSFLKKFFLTISMQ